MSNKEIEIEIKESRLNKAELKLHDDYVVWLKSMVNIGFDSRKRIYDRLIMLHIFKNQDDAMKLERELRRISQPRP